MPRIISKKRALLVTAVTSLALVAVAIAFYTTTGTGSGTGTTRDGYANQLAITGNAPAGLVPGGYVEVDGNVHNGNSGSAQVGTISGTVVAGAPDSQNVANDCPDSYFSVSNVALDNGASNVIAGNGDVGFTARVNMQDAVDGNGAPVNQDVCKNKALSISWSSN